MIRVVAPSRLHFGLFHVPTAGEAIETSARFGGVGLMIDSPAVVVTVRPADSWQFEGRLASRAQVFAMQFMSTLPEAKQRGRFRYSSSSAPAEHTGLGVGTQLGWRLRRHWRSRWGMADWSSVELAERVGRGERSAIGVHGFDRGGLLVEAGKCGASGVAAHRASRTAADVARRALSTARPRLARRPRTGRLRRGQIG